MSWPEGNPFSTRYTQPGALTYLFPAGQSAGLLISRLQQRQWWGQVVGPHGAGKTTLLKTLLPHLAAAGRRTHWVTLHRGQRQLPASLHREAGWPASCDQLIIDGYEQLGRAARWKVQRWCRQCGAGLLVTSHRDARLPMLTAVEPSLSVLLQLVQQLLREQDVAITPTEVAERFARHAGNMRETLFALYDLYELRRRQPPAP